MARANDLVPAILSLAFRGELTTQWRKENLELINYEWSAATLLEKIAAERIFVGTQPKAKKENIRKNKAMNKEIEVFDALKAAGKPLSGQQLLSAAGYSTDSSTEKLEQFFLDVRDALTMRKTIIKMERSADGQDWFDLAEAHK